MAKIDKNFLQKGYFETPDKNIVRADLMDAHARAYGYLFASRDRRVQVSSIQLRTFYNDVKSLERKITQGGADGFQKCFYLVKMLKSKASYIQGKGSGGRVSREFRDFIHVCIDKIETEDDFTAFLKFFESTVGFYYGAGGERIT